MIEYEGKEDVFLREMRATAKEHFAECTSDNTSHATLAIAVLILPIVKVDGVHYPSDAAWTTGKWER